MITEYKIEDIAGQEQPGKLFNFGNESVRSVRDRVVVELLEGNLKGAVVSWKALMILTDDGKRKFNPF